MIHTLVLAAQLVSADVSFAQAKMLADGYEAALTTRDMTALVEAQGKVLSAAMAACRTSAGRPTSFTVVARVERDGITARTWRNQETPYAICMDQQLAGAALPVATGKAFHTSYELSFGP